MKVTHDWLKDFVDIKITPQALAHKLTMAGIEVTSLQGVGNDFVYEIEITSNRPDWLSVVGIAREVAAITGKRLKWSPVPSPQSRVKDKRQLNINIEDKKDCPLYTARVIRGVKVGPSPDWLKRRLELVGLRSVNNVVDITNYILLEYGEPLHAFDLDKLIGDSILVRRAKQNEKIITIDGIQRALDIKTLVIADQNRAVALAGVMGGKDTEVSEQTKNVLLEAAIFNPIIIRRGRQALGLQSESAYRFERGIDREVVEKASGRASQLIEELASGECILIKSLGLSKPAKKTLNLDLLTVNKTLGVNIPCAKVKQIMDHLGFQAKQKRKNVFAVTVPSFRQDVGSEIDMIEEIARVYGYENIPMTLPAIKAYVTPREAKDSISFIKNMLIGLGLNEVMTYSLIDKGLLRDFGLEVGPEIVEILNPLSKEQETLRPTLMPSLARCVAFNLNQKQEYINIFEIANVFSARGLETQEQLSLGFAFCGSRPFWTNRGRIQDGAGFLHLKGVIENLFLRLGVKTEEFNIAEKNSFEFCVSIGGVGVGVLRKLEEAILDKLGIKNKDVFAAEINLDKLINLVKLDKKFSPLPKFPGVTRDISLVLKEGVPAEQVLRIARQKGEKLLQGVAVTDYYKGKQIEKAFKGLTVSCYYCSPERTLTEEEINPIHAGIVGALEEELSAKIR
jgi:phenylalanyl-tRNA synthetase beta chain